MKHKNIVTNIDEDCNTQNDGVFYDRLIGEFVIRIDGEVIGYNEQQQRAWDQYNDELRTRREHAQRNPANIPFMGEPVEEYTMADFYGVSR